MGNRKLLLHILFRNSWWDTSELNSTEIIIDVNLLENAIAFIDQRGSEEIVHK